MAFRNGIIADMLRNAGMPYKVIFGLQLPQLRQIAASINTAPPEETIQTSEFAPAGAIELARALWADVDVRESRLLAPMLFPGAELEQEEAHGMLLGVLTREEADILTFTLIRKLSYACELLRNLTEQSAMQVLNEADSSGKPFTPLQIYAIEALRRNLG